MKFPDRELKQQCSRILSGHRPLSQRAWLEKLAASPEIDLPRDMYGEGPAVALLEKEVAELLGKEAAVFVPKGVIAQQAALRAWTARRRCGNVALHPSSHIDLDERNAYERLHPLYGIRLGQEYAPFTVEDLEKAGEPLGVITVELPLRRAGFKLPAWEELTAIAEWARQRHIPLHFDGARLWESAPFYGRSYAEISALADSVYVSFYKGLGGLGGCVLAGPADFIAETQVWKARMGGNLYTAFPYVLSALQGLREHLPAMPEYCRRAGELAAALARVPGLYIVPNPPQTNGFQVYLPGELAALQEATHEIARREGAWLFDYFTGTSLPGLVMTEIQLGENSLNWNAEEMAGLVGKLVAIAGEPAANR